MRPMCWLKISCIFFLLIILITVRKFRRQPPGELEKNVYISGAYLLSSRHIRVILVKKCDDYGGIYAMVEGENNDIHEISASITPIHDECPWKGCRHEGFFAEFHLPVDFTGEKLFLKTGPERSTKVIIRKSLQSSETKHVLSICVASMSFYENSAQLVRFIEYWTISGATKFYFYWQSLTIEVNDLIGFYRKTAGIDIEMIPWPKLPDVEVDKDFFYTGQLTSINDCLHRARGKAEFVAVVDLDEYIISFHDKTLTDLLNQVESNVAGLLFYSRSGNLLEKFSERASDPKNLLFPEWATIRLDKQVNKLRSKIIARPELIKRGNIHFAEESEGWAWGTVAVPAEKAVLIHIRYVYNGSDESKILAKTAIKMAENWKSRWRPNTPRSGNFTITEGHYLISKNISDCLETMWNWGNGTCFTVSRCEPKKLFGNTKIEWIFPHEQWVIL